MASKRDWVDYANLGANVIQTAQLDAINSKLHQMSELELQKEYRAQQEVAVARHEDMLREAVFYYSEQLRDIEETAVQNPSVAYIRASHLKGAYSGIPQFKSTGFRRFEDKERLGKAQRECDRVIRDSAAKLNPEVFDKCDRCIRHILDRNDLLRLIAAQEERELLEKDYAALPSWIGEQETALETAKAELDTIKPAWFQIIEPVANVVLKISGFCALVSLVAFVATFLIEEPFPLFGWLFPLSLLICVVASIPMFSPYARKHYQAQEHILAIASSPEARKYELSRRERELKYAESLYAKLGSAQADGYREMLRRRDALLNEMLGDLATDFIRRTVPRGSEPPEQGEFAVVLSDVPADKKLSIIKAMMETVPDLGLAQATALTDTLPNCLLTDLYKSQADDIASKLERAGAVVEVCNYA